MADLFDYLDWRGDLDFKSSAFNEVDAMILSRFVYLPFEYTMPQNDMNGKTAKDICDELIRIPELDSELIYKDDKRLIREVRNSPRIGNLKVFRYATDTDNDSQTQFAAICVQLKTDEYYICYRGTDSSLVGWKEDLNMGFICPVPAQELALKYFVELSEKLDGRFVLGGHSKGGNLAVYAAAYCPKELKSRIYAIYNFDGPGFNEKVLASEGFGDIWGKVFTFVPQSSVIGMILTHDENYTIVKSQAGGLLQHDTYSWQIERNKFIYLETVDKSSRAVDYALREWISNMDYKQREEFIETLYKILSETNARTFKEFGENWLSNLGVILKSIKNLDEYSRKAALETLKALAESAKNGIIHVIEKEKSDG